MRYTLLYHSSNDLVLKRFLDDIRQTQPISRQEEKELFRHLKAGSQAARKRLIASNMRFVLKVALQYRGCPIPLTDLVNEGSLGLIRAIESYDDSRGLKFISYAVWWIKAFITRAINETGCMIRLPANQLLRVRKAIKSANLDAEAIPSDIQEMMQLCSQGSSFDQPLNEGSKNTLADVLSDDSNISIDQQQDRKRIEEIMQQFVDILPPTEARVIQGIYGFDNGEPKALREIARNMGISNERVRQLRDQAIRRIKRHTPDKTLKVCYEGYLSAVG